MSAEVIELAKAVREHVPKWKTKAAMFALFNPIGFYMAMGCTFPQYLSVLNDLERKWEEVEVTCDKKE